MIGVATTFSSRRPRGLSGTMLTVVTNDEGGMRRARALSAIEESSAPSKRPGQDGKDRPWWRCTFCDKRATEIKVGGDVYSEYKSHIVNAHDPEDLHDQDGTSDQSLAMKLFPESTLRARAKKAEKKAAREASKAAAPPSLPPPPLPRVYGTGGRL